MDTNNKNQSATRQIIINIDECNYSNPNGDPCKDGEPRIDPQGYGIISSPSRRKKQRLIIENKNGEIWKYLQKKYNLDENQFEIEDSDKQDKEKLTKMSLTDVDAYLNKYWDARVFGGVNVYEKIKGKSFKGIIQTDTGRSVSILPELIRATCTVSHGVSKDKSVGMAPNSIKVVPYAIYKTRENIDGFNGYATNCTNTDIEIFKEIVRFTWVANRSQSRTGMYPIHIHCITFKDHLDMHCDMDIENDLTPRLKDGITFGMSRNDFIIPTWEDIANKYSAFVTYEDLVTRKSC